MVRTLKIRSGASLVEISIAMVIVAVAVIAMMTFSRNTFLISKDARGSDAAYLSAEKKVSELAAKKFPAASGNDKDTVDNIICSRTWTVQDTGYIKRAIVTVTFKSLKGGNRQVTLTGAIH